MRVWLKFSPRVGWLILIFLMVVASPLALASRSVEVFGGVTKSGPVNPEVLTQEQYRRELAKLDALDRGKDLDGLIQAGDKVDKRWGTAGGLYYALLMMEISNLLENHFSDKDIYPTSQKYASRALARSDNFPLWVETMLLRFLSRDLAEAGSTDWINERRSKTRLWLHAWGRLERDINRKFNFEDRPRLNLTPPAETGLPSGVAPENIKDPKLRSRYEADIAANAKKGREYSRQFELRKLDRSFPQEAQDYVVRVYSRSPKRVEELSRLLMAYRLNAEIRLRVLNQVKRTDN